jgi:hypothetical protein
MRRSIVSTLARAARLNVAPLQQGHEPSSLQVAIGPASTLIWRICDEWESGSHDSLVGPDVPGRIVRVVPPVSLEVQVLQAQVLPKQREILEHLPPLLQT